MVAPDGGARVFQRSPTRGLGVIMRACFEAITDAFSADGFVPRRICGLWPDWLVWEHVLGNALIWLAYVAMPIMIWRLDRRRPGWRPFQGVIRAFACFIALCGLGHFLDMVAFFHPMYRLSGHILTLTGLVSWWTAWSFRRAWPAFVALKSPEELERIIAERTEELARVEAGLRESEARLRAIVDTAVDGIITIDEGEIIESLNPAALRAFGYSAGELLGRNVNVLMPSPHRDEHDDYLSRFRRTGERKIMGIGREVVGRRKDGTTFPIDLSMSAVSLGQRRIFTGIIRDITERKHAEEALRAKDRVYRAIGESIAYGVWICDVEGRPTYISESFLRMLGLTQEQFSEVGWKEVIHPDEAERTFAAWRECVRLEGTWDAEMRFRGTDGRWHPILGRGVPVRDDDGRIICWAGINLDISRIKETEDALRRSEERQRQALIAARIGHWEWDIREDRLALLGGLKTLYGQPDESPPATFDEFLEFVHPDDRPGLTTAAERSILEGRPFESEFRIAWPDDTVRWMAGKGGIFRDESGAAIRVAGVNIDITEKKEAEARILLLNEGLERRVAERTAELAAARDAAEAATRAKGNFLANMSHEIRTPMGGVIGMTDLLLDTQLDDLQFTYAGTIRSSAEALLTVINDILDFSKIEAGKLTLERTDCDVRTLMKEVADLLVPSANQKGLKICRRIDPRVPARLVGDPVRIRQVLTNLAGNAVKFTDRGEVTLEAILLARGRGKATIRFLVSDTGIGIPEDRRFAIFDSFTQVEGDNSRRYGGTGLGLSICRSLVGLMGGRIGMESTPGRGSTFWFTLELEEGAEVVRSPETLGAGPADGTRAEALRGCRIPLRAHPPGRRTTTSTDRRDRHGGTAGPRRRGRAEWAGGRREARPRPPRLDPHGRPDAGDGRHRRHGGDPRAGEVRRPTHPDHRPDRPRDAGRPRAMRLRRHGRLSHQAPPPRPLAAGPARLDRRGGWLDAGAGILATGGDAIVLPRRTGELLRRQPRADRGSPRYDGREHPGPPATPERGREHPGTSRGRLAGSQLEGDLPDGRSRDAGCGLPGGDRARWP